MYLVVVGSGLLSYGLVGYVIARKPPTRSAWLQLRCCMVGWVMACWVRVRCGNVGSGNAGHVMETTIVLARRPINAAVVG
jgi:hypothetical protein